MHFRKFALPIAIISCVVLSTVQAKGEVMTIKNGSKVAFNYTLTVDGNVVDSSEGREPVEYTHGEGSILPGLSRQIKGMKQGDKKHIELQPQDGCGEVNSDAFREISRSDLPEDIEPQVDMMLQMQVSDGRVMPVRISEVKEESIVLDLNHPFAGKSLEFDIQIVSID